jgi:hypothetical protein
VSLRQCIEVEMSNISQFLTNRYKLAALSTIDVTNAKRRQYLEAPPPEAVIVEEENEADSGNQKAQHDMDQTDTHIAGNDPDSAAGNAFC